MLAIISELGFWSWMIAGLLFTVLEVIVPGAAFLWLGVSALVVGVIVFLIPSLDWRLQVTVFAVLSVVSVIIWRRYLRQHPIESDQPNLNKRGRQYVGKVYILHEPIADGVGHLRIDDTRWRIQGAEMAAGTRVKVTALDGMTLLVEAVGEDASEQPEPPV